LFSIIIPAHNEYENLKRLLSILEGIGNGIKFEIVIALSKNNSDGTMDLSQKGNVRTIVCNGKGRALQMNTGAKLAKGDILIFLHADVLPPSGFFDDIKTTLSNGYDAGFFSYRFDKESFFLNINASFTGRDGIFTGGGDQCLFIRRTIFEELGRFDEDQVLMEDFEFFHRMKKSKVPYTIVRNDLVVSSRKYEKNSYLRVNVSNLILLVLFRFGYPPKKLDKLHNLLIR
jgi:rSAM/selenodomain-associated transferase 2